AGKLAGKIRELSSGACYNPDKTGYIEFDRSKLNALVAEIAKRNTRVAVCYWYQHELERIRQVLPHAVLYEGKVQEDLWNAGKIEVLLIHPQASGHGINLQFGGHVMIWFSIIRSQELWSQTCMRLPRRGQKNTVKLIHLIAEGSSDEAALQALLTNQENEQAVIDAVMQWVG
ncbi:MAG TPA: hypothetical protein VFV43_01540, partial [Limnobacter sp.]|nr:hypothetical protein [Limnobacter sp.]